VASAGEDKTVKIFDANSAQEVAALRGHAGIVWSMAWSPDGRRIASASSDTTIKIWDAAAGREVFSLAGHTKPVRSVAWDRRASVLLGRSGFDDQALGRSQRAGSPLAGGAYRVCLLRGLESGRRTNRFERPGRLLQDLGHRHGKDR